MKHDFIIIINGKIEKRLSLIKEAVRRARQEIMAQEDEAIFATLDTTIFTMVKNGT